VAAYDPAVPQRYPFKVDSLEDALRGACGIAVLARQRNIDYEKLAEFRKLMKEDPFIVDTRNVYNRRQAEAAGFRLETL
jgi:UDP-N-acetyl-D-mannosaminuronic acid dehydrogenase